MDAARTNIAHLHGIVLVEYVLHAERALERLRIELVHDDVVRRGKPLCGDVGKGYDTPRSRRNTSTRKEAAAGWAPRITRAVDRAAQLRRQRQNADVVIENIIRNPEPGPDGGCSTRTGRVNKADTRAPIVFGSARLAEVNQARYTRCLVQLLRALAKRNGRIFTAYAEIQSEVLPQAPIVICIPIPGCLVTVINGITEAPLCKRVRRLVCQIEIQS